MNMNENYCYTQEKFNEDEEESVYNLIEKPTQIKKKSKRYKSKYPGNAPPSYSTLALNNTSKTGIANVEGSYENIDTVGPHQQKKQLATMGRNVRDYVGTDKYLRKTQGLYNDTINKMKHPTKEKHERKMPNGFKKRDPVPKKNDKPIMGLRSKKNFISSNAVENILSAPKKVKKSEGHWTDKAEFGKVPEYLRKVKEEVNDEYQYMKELEIQHQQRQNKAIKKLSEEEKEEFLEALRNKWNHLHQKYQNFSFTMPQDKVHLQRKENVEKEMDQLEKQILKLSKENIYIYEDESDSDEE
jgi:hypothetical protein